MPGLPTDVLDDLAKSFRENKLLPICGAGFSRNVAGRHRAPPDWAGLLERLAGPLQLPRREAERLTVFRSVGDDLSGLSLVSRHLKSFHKDAEASIRSTSASLDEVVLPAHRAFWTVGWQLVLTTNFDTLLQQAWQPARLQTVTYQSRDLSIDELEQWSKNAAQPVVLHLHGAMRDVDADRPLLTWQDYFDAFDLRTADLVALSRLLTARVRKSLRVEYRAALTRELRLAFRARERRVRHAGPLRRLLRDILDRFDLLLLGFSLRDPIWLLLLHEFRHRPPRERRAIFLVTRQPNAARGLPARVTELPIGDWRQMTSLFRQLANHLHADTVPGAALERESRKERYADLAASYPTFSRRDATHSPKWVFENDATLVPFIELWANSRQLPAEKAVLGLPVPRLRAHTSRAAFLRHHRMLIERYWNHRARSQRQKADSEPLVNEVKMRVSGWQARSDGRLELRVEPVEYKEFLFTNHLVANLGTNQLDELRSAGATRLARALGDAFHTSNGFDPRATLCGTEAAVALRPAALCSNHLGVSSIAIANRRVPRHGNVPVLICPPSRGQISSPQDIIPTASGSVDWPMPRNARSERDVYTLRQVRRDPTLIDLRREVRREFGEECLSLMERAHARWSLGLRRSSLLTYSDEVFAQEVIAEALVNLCQNIERGGKPELFYILTLRLPAHEFIRTLFKPNWELQSLWYDDPGRLFDILQKPGVRAIALIPSPLTVDLKLQPRWRQALEYLAQVIANPRYNPVLRAHLVAVVRHCEMRFGRIGPTLKALGLASPLSSSD